MTNEESRAITISPELAVRMDKIQQEKGFKTEEETVEYLINKGLAHFKQHPEDIPRK